jgi:hypothetical protein
MRTTLLRSIRRGLIPAVLLAAVGAPALGDEGMWLFSNPPVAMIEKTYGLSLSPEWFEKVQKAAVRFSDGGSGSFVSADGLVLTNHHVASGQIAKLSTPERDLTRDGFLAQSRDEELPCPDLELLSLQRIEDVTDRVKATLERADTPAELEAARKQVIAEIEAEAKAASGLHSVVVTLYGGGMYHLYQYHRYTDVRLVFAPEEGIAFLGGDVDNFEFPRFNLDMALVRAYENGEPVRPVHHLRFSPTGASEGQPVFVAGHPGTTRRGYTMDHLRAMRDRGMPRSLDRLFRREVELNVFASQDAESARIANDDLRGVENGRKARTGMQSALLDARVMAQKAEDERRLREAVAANPEWNSAWGGAWDEVARAQEMSEKIAVRSGALEGLGVLNSRYASIARSIVRLVEEREKPSGERLAEFRDSALPSFEMRLYSTAPIYDSLERNKLESGFMSTAASLGADDPLVRVALGGKSPADRARELVDQTTLEDVGVRRALVDGGRAAIEASRDPFIRLVRELDSEARTLRAMGEEADAIERAAYDKITAARFAVFGTDMYPDATFTLRLATGRVSGFEQEGLQIAPFTTFAGLWERSEAMGGEGVFAIPARWAAARERLNPETPFNLVSTNDIIGGNSGSPLIDERGDLVGLIFDGNRYSFVWSTVYEGRRGRAVSVDVRAMVEALREVYGATALVEELTAAR